MDNGKGLASLRCRRAAKQDFYENVVNKKCKKNKCTKKAKTLSKSCKKPCNNQPIIKKSCKSFSKPCPKPCNAKPCVKTSSCDKICGKTCQTVCDKLNLFPPEGACEKKTVKHNFKVTLGECKVRRDVKVTHCITANLDHHIKENIICKHPACTKYTCEEKNKVVEGKKCDVKFPEQKDITFIDESCCSKKTDCSDSSSSDSSCSSSTSSCGSDSSSSGFVSSSSSSCDSSYLSSSDYKSRPKSCRPKCRRAPPSSCSSTNSYYSSQSSKSRCKKHKNHKGFPEIIF